MLDLDVHAGILASTVRLKVPVQIAGVPRVGRREEFLRGVGEVEVGEMEELGELGLGCGRGSVGGGEELPGYVARRR